MSKLINGSNNDYNLKTKNDVTKTTQDELNNNNTIDYNFEIEFNQNQQKLIQIITKQSLLVLIGCVMIFFYDVIRAAQIFNVAIIGCPGLLLFITDSTTLIVLYLFGYHFHLQASNMIASVANVIIVLNIVVKI